MDDDEYEFMVELPEAPSRRFRRLDLLIVGLNLAASLLDAASGACSDIASLTAMHVNYEQDQDTFHQEAAREIEALVADVPEED